MLLPSLTSRMLSFPRANSVIASPIADRFPVIWWMSAGVRLRSRSYSRCPVSLSKSFMLPVWSSMMVTLGVSSNVVRTTRLYGEASDTISNISTTARVASSPFLCPFLIRYAVATSTGMISRRRYGCAKNMDACYLEGRIVNLALCETK